MPLISAINKTYIKKKNLVKIIKNMKILAVQNRMGIGDMIIFLPFIEAISKKFNSPISILVKENSKAIQVLKGCKYIDRVIILDRDTKIKMENMMVYWVLLI